MTDLIPLDRQELVSRAEPLDLAIAAWLDAKRGRSGSVHTAHTYETTLTGFRAQLHAGRLDLDGDPRAVALVAQRWAALTSSGGTIAPATFNQRLAVLSSFYTFARKRGLLATENPIGLVERRPVQGYAGAEALRPADVRQRLAGLDRATIEGQRDYAILSVALQTGRRVAELAALRWRDVRIEGDRVRLHFARTKGGKTIADVLPPGVSRALSSYLHALYGAQLGDLAPEAPIWVRLDRAADGREALSARSLENIARDRLGVHFHGLRHTFARTMEDAGAKVSEIQGRLGHSSLQTTGRYLAALRQAENPHGDKLAALLGLGE